MPPPDQRKPLPWGGAFDGARYQEKFDALAAAGESVHGEVDFLMAYEPTSVLDAGCGTGRVAIELAHRGVDVVGVDVSESMLATATERAPDIAWTHADLTTLDLHRTFDIVVMAGNVPLFTPEGTEAALVAHCAAHLRAGGLLIAGFQIGRGYDLADYDRQGEATDLTLVERFSTWDRTPFTDTSDYAVSVSTSPGEPVA